MRRTIILVLLVSMFLTVSAAYGSEITGIDRDEISLKAGPTAPGEGLSMVWLEALVYPKIVRSDKVVSLGVRLTAKVDKVIVSFDFNEDKVKLTSDNGIYWSGAYQIPDGISAGLHVARYAIIGDKGEIQRTVEFFVDRPAMPASNDDVSHGEVYAADGWPLTVTSTTSALVEGSSRVLYTGQRVIGLSKVPWYKVVFEDGEVGYISAMKVKEPIGEYFTLGQEAYHSKKFSSAISYFKDVVAIDKRFISGYLWLAKSYEQQGNIEASYRVIKTAIELDDRDMESRVFSNHLAKRYYAIANKDFKGGRFHEAIAAYQKVIDLKPSSITSWVELGKCYGNLGMGNEARASYGEALRNDPDNPTVLALLNVQTSHVALASVPQPAKPIKVVKTMPKTSNKVPALVADDSLIIVKAEKTRKGTSIDSALRSVIALTKSLGTPVAEKGWEIKERGSKFLVRYLCEQGQEVLEAFEWVVDVDTRRVSAYNDNARLLMTRW
ncbi:MAG: tetratricopeptide repeat protein [Candidatus Margulisiibacteriota bacterium]|nr:tetratricopeptide repeat protein [Candidatus Margulisiibacteriota bacterium]